MAGEAGARASPPTVARSSVGTCWSRSFQAWNVDARVSTLACQPAGHVRGAADQVRMAVHMHDVVQIAWATTLSERTQFLCEQLIDAVASYAANGQRLVTVRVRDAAPHRSVDQNFVTREIDLDLRQSPGRVETAEGDLATRRILASLVRKALERLIAKLKFDTRLLLHPRRNTSSSEELFTPPQASNTPCQNPQLSTHSQRPPPATRPWSWPPA